MNSSAILHAGLMLELRAVPYYIGKDQRDRPFVFHIEPLAPFLSD